jgi:tRNA nucleotidyltransferase (CCA-adding enzyme)
MRYNQKMAQNLAGQIRETLFPGEWQLLQHVAEAASTLRMPLYAVGGFPRDLLLGYPRSDFDLVVEGAADQLAQKLASLHGGKVTVHSKFGTAKWSLVGTIFHEGARASHNPTSIPNALDFVSARSETYRHPAALPAVKLGTIADDLRRRDFTINALAVRLDGAHFGDLLDDLGGGDDLNRRLVRVLHDNSFVDDPTRMYRAARYEQRYEFKIEGTTERLLPAAREVVGKLSPHRIRHELDLILDEERAGAIVDRLAALDLLKPIHAALTVDQNVSERISRYERRPTFVVPAWPAHEVRWLLWLMSLPASTLDSLNRRLHFSATLFKALRAASTLLERVDPGAEFVPSRWVQLLDDMPLLSVYAVCLALPPGSGKSALEKYMAEWRHMRSRTTGHDLKRLGVSPGPEYQSILGSLRRAWLDGLVHSEAEENEYLQGLLDKAQDKQ